MIDQESLVLTVLILGVGYMLLNNTQGPPVDPNEGQREALEAVKSLKTRAENMLARASEFHSQVGDMDRVDEGKRELMSNFLRYQREASQMAVRYPERQSEIEFFVNEIEKAKVNLIPDTYKRSGETLEEPAKRSWSPDLREVSQARSQPVRGVQQRHRFRSQLPFMQMSPIQEMGEMRPLSRMEEDLPNLKEDNRHHVEVVSGVGSGGGAFNVAPPRTSEVLNVVTDRVAEEAGLVDSTQIAVNSNDPELAAVNSELKPGVPIPRVQSPVEVLNYVGKNTGPHDAPKAVGERVIRNHEPDRSQASEANNSQDHQQPSGGRGITLPVEVADNKDDEPPAAPRSMPGGVKPSRSPSELVDLVQPVPARPKKTETVFSQFARDPQYKHDMEAAIVSKIQAHIAHIQVILQGRMREQQRAQFNESLNFIANHMENNDTVARQLSAWRAAFGKIKGRDVTVPHIVLGGIDEVSGLRQSGSRLNRDVSGDRARRDREQRNINLRESAKRSAADRLAALSSGLAETGEAVSPRGRVDLKKRSRSGSPVSLTSSEPEYVPPPKKKKKRASLALDLESLKGRAPRIYRVQQAAYTGLANEYRGRLPGAMLESNQSFWKNIRSRLIVRKHSRQETDVEIRNEAENLEKRQLLDLIMCLQANPGGRGGLWGLSGMKGDYLANKQRIKAGWNQMVSAGNMRKAHESSTSLVQVTPFP